MTIAAIRAPCVSEILPVSPPLLTSCNKLEKLTFDSSPDNCISFHRLNVLTVPEVADIQAF
jgi:hypothetical protein